MIVGLTVFLLGVGVLALVITQMSRELICRDCFEQKVQRSDGVWLCPFCGEDQ